MEVVVASHPAALGHDTGRGHPESSARVGAVLRGIHATGLEVVGVESPRIDTGTLGLVHDPGYIDMIKDICSRGGGLLDVDTAVSPESWEASLRSVGGVVALVEQLEKRPNATGFAVCRPPGHHAERSRAMGFCVFNNVAVAAATIRARGLRVAILDWDVHHGNGTQSVVAGDPGTLYISLHQADHYPLSGRPGDIDSPAHGTTVNIPLPYGTAGDVYRMAWSDIVLEVVVDFSPDWVLVSAGYDAHVEDPLAGLRLVDDDYGWLAVSLAAVHPPGRTILALEGGYDMDALAGSARATVLGLAGSFEPGPPLMSGERSLRALEEARSAIAKWWPV